MAYPWDEDHRRGKPANPVAPADANLPAIKIQKWPSPLPKSPIHPYYSHGTRSPPTLNAHEFFPGNQRLAQSAQHEIIPPLHRIKTRVGARRDRNAHRRRSFSGVPILRHLRQLLALGSAAVRRGIGQLLLGRPFLSSPEATLSECPLPSLVGGWAYDVHVRPSRAFSCATRGSGLVHAGFPTSSSRLHRRIRHH